MSKRPTRARPYPPPEWWGIVGHTMVLTSCTPGTPLFASELRELLRKSEQARAEHNRAVRARTDKAHA